MVFLLALVEAYRRQCAKPVLSPGFLEIAHGGGGKANEVSWAELI